MRTKPYADPSKAKCFRCGEQATQQATVHDGKYVALCDSCGQGLRILTDRYLEVK